MSRVCELTGKRAQSGNNVSKAMNKTRRKFNVNLVKKNFFIPETGEFITLKVSAKAIKKMNKVGITAMLKEARAKGYLNR